MIVWRSAFCVVWFLFLIHDSGKCSGFRALVFVFSSYGILVGDLRVVSQSHGTPPAAARVACSTAAALDAAAAAELAACGATNGSRSTARCAATSRSGRRRSTTAEPHSRATECAIASSWLLCATRFLFLLVFVFVLAARRPVLLVFVPDLVFVFNSRRNRRTQKQITEIPQ